MDQIAPTVGLGFASLLSDSVRVARRTWPLLAFVAASACVFVSATIYTVVSLNVGGEHYVQEIVGLVVVTYVLAFLSARVVLATHRAVSGFDHGGWAVAARTLLATQPTFGFAALAVVAVSFGFVFVQAKSGLALTLGDGHVVRNALLYVPIDALSALPAGAASCFIGLAFPAAVLERRPSWSAIPTAFRMARGNSSVLAVASACLLYPTAVLTYDALYMLVVSLDPERLAPLLCSDLFLCAAVATTVTALPLVGTVAFVTLRRAP